MTRINTSIYGPDIVQYCIEIHIDFAVIRVNMLSTKCLSQSRKGREKYISIWYIYFL